MTATVRGCARGIGVPRGGHDWLRCRAMRARGCAAVLLSPRLAAVAAVAVLALAGVACRAPASSPRAAPATGWNLLLVTLDTLRADRLGCYGRAAAETPALD